MFSKLISTAQLYKGLQSGEKILILDTTYTLPSTSPIDNHFKNRIPRAKFLDIKKISEESSGLTLTMPSTDRFIDFMRTLRIPKDNTPLVIYDMFNMTSPRAWFMFKVFGRENVSVLDGGLAKWIADKHPLVQGTYAFDTDKDIGPGYEYVRNEKLISNFEEVVRVSKDHSKQVLDARPAKAFNEDKIPGSTNVPFDDVYLADKTFKNPEELRKIFERAGLDLSKPVVSSCRIGHSACVNLFALELAGKEATLYDGSWEEWSAKRKSAA